MSIKQGNSIIAGKPVWGGIGGTLSNQTDLQNALDSKANSADVYTKADVDTITNNKANTNLSNTPANIDYVIDFQIPTATNNYTWYRKYKSGWVEQGCLACYLPAQGASTEARVPFTFPIVMSSSAYDVSWALMTDGGFTAELTQIGVVRNNNNCSVRFYSLMATVDKSQVTVTVRGMSAN